MKIELTQDEARALIGLLDVAVKAAGLQAAQAALPIAIKVQTALDTDAKAAEAAQG